MAGSTALSIVYAIDTQPNDDPILEVAEKGAESLFEIGNAGSYLGMRDLITGLHWR